MAMALWAEYARPTRPGRCRMGQERKFGSITYQDVGADYFEKRRLRRHAGMWSLWALGVGAVISGEYYGWNFGLGTGGFYGLAVAGVFMAIMYYGLVDRKSTRLNSSHVK